MSTEIKRAEFTDIHTHILPGFDDGSQSSAESFSMLCELYRQGVSRVVLTPHFYARQDEPSSFVLNRDAAAEHLVGRLDEFVSNSESPVELPEIYLGSEVAFFNAISICPELDRMCIGGTKYLLVEMPFDNWTGAMLQELYVIKNKLGITPIIAHIERYFSLFNRDMLDEMISEGMIIQSNAEAFLHLGTRRRALKLLEDGRIHILGSDCHNTEKRAPNIKDALDVIEKKLGADAIAKLCENGKSILDGADPIRLGS